MFALIVLIMFVFIGGFSWLGYSSDVGCNDANAKAWWGINQGFAYQPGSLSEKIIKASPSYRWGYNLCARPQDRK